MRLKQGRIWLALKSSAKTSISLPRFMTDLWLPEDFDFWSEIFLVRS